MTTWALLAPGPTASAQVAENLRGVCPVGAVGNAFQHAPWADFIAATDKAWWRNFPQAKELPGTKYAMHEIPGVEKISIPGWNPCNSGVLAMECAKREGATRIILADGFDMHGSHFFGQYRNGLRNTAPHQRKQHFKQYEAWAKANRNIQIVNCTEGSALKCFPTARLEECLRLSSIFLTTTENPSPTIKEILMAPQFLKTQALGQSSLIDTKN